MIITADILKHIAPNCKKKNQPRLDILAYQMNHYFPQFNIDTVGEYCHFLAQAAHETDSFNSLVEYASGQAYEGRKDLGNTVPGYGVKFKGAGIFMTTGYTNYKRLDQRLPAGSKISFVRKPELLQDPEWAVWSACLFWDDRDFNTIANMPDSTKIPVKRQKHPLSPIEYISYRVNGGFNGILDRKACYARAKEIIK